MIPKPDMILIYYRSRCEWGGDYLALREDALKL